MQRAFKLGNTTEVLLLNREELAGFTEEQVLATVRVVSVDVSPCCQTRSFATRKTTLLPHRCLRCRCEFAQAAKAPYYVDQETMDAKSAVARRRSMLLKRIDKKLDTLKWEAFYAAVDASSHPPPSFPTAPLGNRTKLKRSRY
jgi:hypothetical protein